MTIGRFSSVALIGVLMFAGAAHADPVLWNVEGQWNLYYYVNEGIYGFTMTITSEDFVTGTFLGIDSNGYQVTGQTTGSSIQFNDPNTCGGGAFQGYIGTDGILFGSILCGGVWNGAFGPLPGSGAATPVAVSFGNANVCPSGQSTPAPCSQTIALNYSSSPYNATTFGITEVVTEGAPNLDFTLSGASTCAGTLPAGTPCTVNVTFAPLAPGVRIGAVQLTDSSGNLLVATLVFGLGQAPAVAFAPGVQTTVGSGLSEPGGVAVDASGDVFIADTQNNRVVEVPAGGGAETAVGSGLNQPGGVAVDGAGDVFIADTQNNRVVEIQAIGGVQTTVGSGLNQPGGVAVDGAGDIFIADTQNNRVVEVPAGGGAQTTVGGGLAQPSGVAVDGAGNVFIADRGNSRVVEVPAGGGAQTTVGSGLDQPAGVAVDGAGDVFIADSLDNRVAELQRSQPPTLSFASTPVGATSSDSPQSISIQNIGNLPLDAVAPGLTVGTNFVQVPGPGSLADCTSAFALTPGAACNLSISFEPQSIGNFQSAATFTDNALNAAAAIQSVTLLGDGIPNTATTTTLTSSANPSDLNQPVTFTATVTAQNDGSPTGKVVFYNGSKAIGSGPVAGNTAAFTTPSLAAGSHQITGKYSGDTFFLGSTSPVLTQTVKKLVFTVTTLSGVSPNPTVYGEPVILTATVTGGTTTPTGTVTFLQGAVKLGAGTLANGTASYTTKATQLAVGTYQITASYGGSASDGASASQPVALVVNQAATATVLTSSQNPSNYGQPVTFTAIVSPQFGGAVAGTVTFYNGATVLKKVSLSGGAAAYATTALKVGVHSITATYNGSTQFDGSSGSLTQTVN